MRAVFREGGERLPDVLRPESPELVREKWGLGRAFPPRGDPSGPGKTEVSE